MQTTGIPEGGEGVKKCPACHNICKSRFCPECGTATVDSMEIICRDCGYKVELKGRIPRFCPECGHKITTADMKFN